jgi:predicted dehydrogenase
MLLEKPLATTERDCRRIIAAVQRAGVVCAVAHVLRYTAYSRLLKELIDRGAIGDIVSIEHLVVDHQVVSLRYENGTTASLTMTAFTRMRDRETRIFGTRGELHGDGNRVDVYDFLTGTTTRHESGVCSDGEIPTGHGGGDDGVMREFIAAVAGRRPGPDPHHTRAHARVTPHRLRRRSGPPREPRHHPRRRSAHLKTGIPTPSCQVPRLRERLDHSELQQPRAPSPRRAAS